MRWWRRIGLATGWMIVASLVRPLPAAAEESAQELSKKLSNPVSDMVSVPFQFNWENGVGPDEGLKTVLNIQPVVPIAVNERWNLIERWIMPYVSQPEFLGSASGFSDITFSSFLSPAGGSSVTWGVGPVLNLPMTSDPALGTGKWSAGPTAVVLKTSGSLIYGFLWNQLWSFADASHVSRAEVNQGFFQPFFAYCTSSGVTYTLQSESVANWKAPTDQWTVPINFIASKITKLGPFPMSVAGGLGVYVASPDGGPEWKIRTAFTVLLPRKQ